MGLPDSHLLKTEPGPPGKSDRQQALPLPSVEEAADTFTGTLLSVRASGYFPSKNWQRS